MSVQFNGMRLNACIDARARLHTHTRTRAHTSIKRVVCNGCVAAHVLTCSENDYLELPTFESCQLVELF